MDADGEERQVGEDRRDLDGVVLDMLVRVLATVPPAVWERRSCGVGTKCARYYDWVAVAVAVEGRAT